MREALILLSVWAVLISLAFAGEPPGWDENFAFEKVDRIQRIDFEIRQVEQELRGLQRERACAAKAKDRKALKACAGI